MLNNEEVAICEICGKEYLKRIKRKKGRRGRCIRGCNTKTCSKRCSIERERKLSKLKREEKKYERMRNER